MGESAVEDKLRELMEASDNPTLAPYAKDSEVMLRVTARAKTLEESEALMQPMLAKVRETLGDIIYGIDTNSLENTVVSLLRERDLTLATAESCTGGLLSKRITDIPGASRVYRGGVTAYCNDAKTALVGVPSDLLAQYGAVSRETAEALAEGARTALGADIGVGITGVAGPGSDDDGNPEGRVFLSIATPDGVFTRAPELYYDRTRIRVAAASGALDMIRRYLTGLPVEGEAFR